MIKIAPQTKTLICIGTGGVGKTTMAASMAVGFAQQGKKVLVLTIDPSKRLAQALGIKMDGDPHKVNIGKSASGGELWACVVNHEKTFEYFIRHAASQFAEEKKVSEEKLSQLLNNKLYHQLSGRLSGSQEFTSLITLNRYATSGVYDLVILDTPPSQHTWNFLRAPEKIAALFNEGITKWFREADGNTSLLKKIVNIGTSQVLKALELLTGSQFIKELAAFFQAIQKWQKPLEEYILNCHRLLISAQTEFILITALDPSRLVEAQKLSREIRTQGYRLSTVIINRVPSWLSTPISTASERIKNLVGYYQSLENDLQGRLTQFKTQLKVYKCYELRQNTEDAASLQKNFDELVSIN